MSVLLLIITLSSFSQNPLFSKKSVTQDTTKVAKTELIEKDSKSSFNIPIISKLIIKNARLQRELKSKFSRIAKDYKSSSSLKSILLILFLAFAYGVFHSLGPGHGKFFIFSYILTEKPKVLKAIGISYSIAAVHAMSGLLVAFVLMYIFKEYSTYSYSVSSSPELISKISFFFLILIGAFMLYRTLFSKDEDADMGDRKKIHLVPFVLSVGLVPCPGTIITVVFLASMGLTFLGILSVFFIILGMGLTISSLGLVSMFSKKLILRFSKSSNDSKKYAIVYKIFGVVGASMLLIFGLLMFLGSF